MAVNTDSGLGVRFTVFHEAGPVLAYCVAPASSFASKAGVRFRNYEEMVGALNAVGLPGSEIATFTDKTYSVSREDLRALGFLVPD